MHSLSQSVHRIHTGETTALELTKAVIAAAGTHAALNVYTHFDADALLQVATTFDELDSAARQNLPLAGVPLIIKDNMNTRFLPTSAGTPALKHHVPESNALVVERLLAAGALIAGKANLHELSSGGTSNNGCFGPVANPYDPACIPGGSSGGTAAAVAAGMVSAGLGTDTAGSVRVPVALCGVAGFRASTRRYPVEGIVPLTHSFDTPGPIATNVTDIVLLDQVLSDDNNIADPKSADTLRLGVPTATMVAGATPEVRQVFDVALKKLASAGVELVEVDLSEIIKLGVQASTIIMDAEFVPLMRAYLEAHAPSISLEQLAQQIASPTVQKIVQRRLQQEPDRACYTDAVENILPRLKELHQVLHREQQLDALIFPTTTDAAYPRDTDDLVFKEGKSTFAWMYFVNTCLASFADNPSLSIPAGVTRAGMPVGVCLDGLTGEDSRLLAVGMTVETVLEN